MAAVRRMHTPALLTPTGTRQRRVRRRRPSAVGLRSLGAPDDGARPDPGDVPVVLPRAGERGPAALRCWLPFRVPTHAATSATLAGAYPFLAEQGLGSAGVMVGTDLLSGGAFVYDPWVLYHQGVITNPNVLLAGVIGTGKSALAKSLTTRSLAFGVRVYVPGDPKGEWTAVARAVGGVAITLGHGTTNRLNPLDAGPRPTGRLTDTAWDGLVWSRRRELLGVLADTVLGRRLHPVEHTALDTALRATVNGTSEPTMPVVVDHLLDPTAPTKADAAQVRVDGRDVAHALRRLVHGDLAGGVRIEGLRASRRLATATRYEFATKGEPLLWLADAVAGAAGLSIGGDDDLIALLGDRLITVQLPATL